MTPAFARRSQHERLPEIVQVSDIRFADKLTERRPSGPRNKELQAPWGRERSDIHLVEMGYPIECRADVSPSVRLVVGRQADAVPELRLTGRYPRGDGGWASHRRVDRPYRVKNPHAA